MVETVADSHADVVSVHPMARLIRVTLLLLYAALVLPLPLLAPSPWQLACAVGVVAGAVPILALLSEQVVVRTDGLTVGYPRWCSFWFRRGWSLPWSAIAGLKPVATSQGGRVFYVTVRADASSRPSGQATAYLLPQRVERFEAFLQHVQHFTNLDTSGVARLTPAWTYQLLALLSALMLLGEAATLLPSVAG